MFPLPFFPAVYLSGFALTLGFVITRLMELMQELVSGEEERDNLKTRITQFEDQAKMHMSSGTAGEDNDQEGTPMETMPNSLNSSGLRRRNGATSESSSTMVTDDKTE